MFTIGLQYCFTVFKGSLVFKSSKTYFTFVKVKIAKSYKTFITKIGAVSGLGFRMIILDPDSTVLDSSGSVDPDAHYYILRQNIIREATLMRLNDARLLKLPLI